MVTEILNKTEKMFEDQCRLCLKKSASYHSIFDKVITNIIETFTFIKVSENDGLPSTCCPHCLEDINKADNLRTRIIKSDSILRNKLKNNRKNEIVLNSHLVVLKKILPGITVKVNDKTVPNTDISEEKASVCSLVEDIFNTSVNNDDDDDHDHNTRQNISEKICEAERINTKIPSNTKQSIYFSEGIRSIKTKKICADIRPAKSKSKKLLSSKTKPLNNCDSIDLYPELPDHEVFKCRTCSKETKGKSCYYKHLQTHDLSKCPFCSKHLKLNGGSVMNYLTHLDTHFSDKVVCELCGHMAKTKDSLRGHMRYIHKQNLPNYECGMCGKMYKKKSGRDLHLKSMHTGERTFVCHICGMGFFTKPYIEKHIMGKHLKVRPHVCDYCSKAFSSSYALKTHKRKHTNETPYVCTICSDGFRQKVSLKTHLKSKHDIKKYEDYIITVGLNVKEANVES